MPSWKDTRLWKQLTGSSSPECPSVQALLHQWMPDIERVLNAGTSPLDFTLHDKEHSFRVAEWMAKIVPEDVLPKLSAYELALLLLSAYLHDIGMTPELARVERHRRHLVFGPAPEEEGGLSPEEAAEFQTWLDDARGGLVPPLAQDGKAGEDDLRLAAELITYYARHKHNDWSGEWIRRNATGALGSYEGWVEDLVRLCQSHHHVYADLVKEAFDPRPAGHGEVVHLRYLACVLRVADILDVDPERTPPVLFQHRNIDPKSVIYWYKDHDLSVHPDGSSLVVHARPRSAVVEKAVRDTAEWIQFELETCARLDRKKPFSHSSFRASQPLPHRWDFPASIQRDIRPRNDDYVYIDGAFRPNTAKVLELLSGIQLYKEPLAAVRELLQNAFDAVKEQIALERLLEDDPTDAKSTEAITARQSVKLRLEEREGRFWLFCTDSGVGMTRSIIEKYLLVSGSSRRHDILELERRCEAAGFRLGRTGQFGIGVLSYFMLADRVEIRTRRSSEHGDAEAHGWKFQTEGVGSFGELRKDFQRRHGTTVGLRLRRYVVANQEEFLSGLQAYLLNTLVRIPCSLELLVAGESAPRFRIEARWQSLTSRLVDDFINTAEEYYFRESDRFPGDKLPKSQLERRDLALRKWSGVAERFRSAIRWKTEEGELPGGIGHYRLSVPFFHLPHGRSAVFFDFGSDYNIAKPLPILDVTALALQPELRTSFQGMEVRSALADGELIHQTKLPYLAEIDWEDSRAGQITVDRSTFSLTTEASEAVSWLESRGEELQATVLSEEPSDYAELNALLNPLVHPPSEARWFVDSLDQKGLRWETLSLPVLSGAFFTLLGPAVQARRDDRIITVTQGFSVFSGEKSSPIEWCMGEHSRAYPNRPVVASMSPLIILPEHLALPQKLRGHNLFKGDFPPVWSGLAALGSYRFKGMSWLWNRHHPLVQSVKAQDLEWFVDIELWQLSENLLQTKGRAALFLMKILQTLDGERYLELAEDFRAGFWRDLWDRAAVLPARIMAWSQYPYNMGELLVLGPENIERIPYTDPRIPQYLPDPGDEWKVTLIYREDPADT